MFVMVLPSSIIDGIIIWGYAERFVGFCLAVGLAYLIYRFAASKANQRKLAKERLKYYQNRDALMAEAKTVKWPAPDKDKNPKD